MLFTPIAPASFNPPVQVPRAIQEIAFRNRKPFYVANVFFGQTVLILGSNDIRTGGGLSLQYVKPEKRFTFRHKPASMVMEAYFLWTQGGFIEHAKSKTSSVGAIILARFENRTRQGIGLYYDIGWGLQVSDRVSADLTSQLNSTPVFGTGVILPAERNNIYLGLRYMHTSNAGFRGTNSGQNQLMATVGIRF